MPNNIPKVALSYVGQREIPGNMGFTDDQFEKKMIEVGFQKTWAWCALFMELCVKEGNPEFYAKYEKLFSASATGTYKNFDIAKLTLPGPKIGCGVIWRHGSGWQGHAGIVLNYDLAGNLLSTVEGNTNSKGGREGIEVSLKNDRRIRSPYKPEGLNLVGFLNFD